MKTIKELEEMELFKQGEIEKHIRIRTLKDVLELIDEYDDGSLSILKILKARIQGSDKGCGKDFMYISSLNDRRICGQIEDLKHSDNILLCDKCKQSYKEESQNV